MARSFFYCRIWDKKIPEIDLTVVTTREFENSRLHRDYDNVKIDTEIFEFKEDFDLFIDASVLRRSKLLKDSIPFSFYAENRVKIRSSFFPAGKREIKTADLIQYKPVCVKNNTANFICEKEIQEIQNNIETLEFFLQTFFRKESFRPGQLPILNKALQRKSVIGLLPTGGGKSLTYQLAALLQPGITIVIDPIRSLMKDQFDNLVKSGIDACNYINSTLNTKERNKAQQQLSDGQVIFTFVSPERMQIQEFRDFLKNMENDGIYFSYAVIDEVHCVSEWGHDFRVSYLSLGKNLVTYCKTKNLKTIPLFGLTATASFDVLADVERELSADGKAALDEDAIIRFENTNRDELQYEIIKADTNFKTIPIALNSNLQTNVLVVPIHPINPIIKEEQRIFKDKIAVTKQKELLKLLKNIPKKLNEYNNISKELAEKSREISNDQNQPYNIKLPDKTFNDFYNNPKNAGLIFCPHRSWLQGVTDRFKNPPGIYGIADLLGAFPDYKVGFFMGTDDKATQQVQSQIEEKSFVNQDKFINNEFNIMVATKAFGMGIDKPNIRFTVHFAIPSSLESFVQEAGRAGRDRKLAVSFILYNNQEIIKITDNLLDFFSKNGIDISPLKKIENDFVFRKDLETLLEELGSTKQLLNNYLNKNYFEEAYIFLDKNNQLFFHYNSFKGQTKEKYILNELLEKITFPNIPSTKILQDKIKKELGLDVNIISDVGLKFFDRNGQFGGQITFGASINSIIFPTMPDHAKANKVINFIISFFTNKFGNILDMIDWIQNGEPIAPIAGIETELNNKQQIGEKFEIIIGFENNHKEIENKLNTIVFHFVCKEFLELKLIKLSKRSKK